MTSEHWLIDILLFKMFTKYKSVLYNISIFRNSIFRANVDGSNMEKFVTDANGKVTSLALAGSDLFWTTTNSIDNSTGAIVHCNTGDTSRTVIVLQNTTAEPLDIAADERYNTIFILLSPNVTLKQF